MASETGGTDDPLASGDVSDGHATAITGRDLPEEHPGAIAADLLTMAGLDPRAVDVVEFSGPETVLPSSFRVTDAAQALVAAASVAVAKLAEVRSDGRFSPGRIVVDSIESCAAFQSERHLRQPADADLWDGLAGHYETSDGHIQFHTNFPHHRLALLEATGCSETATRADVAAVVSRLERFELERTVAGAGGIAAALRTADEWNDHPHRAHVAGRAPLRLAATGQGAQNTRSADGADRGLRALTIAQRPLAGIRVLDFTRVIAGPVCTRTLAAYGADVLRIGAAGLPVVDSILPDTTLGKRFADCDITAETGRDAVLQLAAEADVAVIGFRPGALASYGVGPDDLLAANPNLVVGTLSAFGSDGPWGAKRGFDSITQTATGIVATEMAAYGSEKPRSLPCQLLDHGTGFLLALGILGALATRSVDSGGRLVETSLLTTRNWLESLGKADPTAGKGLTAEEVAANSESRDSPFGSISHIRHPGTIEGIPARWDRGPAKPGSDPAVWLSD